MGKFYEQLTGSSMLNMDFNQAVAINTQQMAWQTSPSIGVLRKPLERAAKESGHVTSIVQYQAKSHFAEHLHPLGEEILVLEGVFSDEQGDYPAGTYLRNPPGSKHRPFSQLGCTLFVKLNQFALADTSEVRINSNLEPWLSGFGGFAVLPLHQFEQQQVALVKCPAGKVIKTHHHFGGEELLVVSGELKDEHGRYPQHTWLRSPHLSEHHPFAEQDTVILVKRGHLRLDA